ncbi:MAG: hypothetical protein MK078_05870 [Crocinitomicaceae bacterium]|nr:hypothetical protein [Crocinitomicaceae bacterium]
MKTTLLALTVILSSSLFAQLSGDIATDARKIENDIDYTLYSSSKTGILVFDIAVNTDGKVTSCTFDRSASTCKSTPLMMMGKNRILAELKFEKDNGFPTFHRGKVTYTLVNVEDEEEIETEETAPN